MFEEDRPLSDQKPRLARWYIFDSGGKTVGIVENGERLSSGVPRDRAERIVAAQNAFVDLLDREFEG